MRSQLELDGQASRRANLTRDLAAEVKASALEMDATSRVLKGEWPRVLEMASRKVA